MSLMGALHTHCGAGLFEVWEQVTIQTMCYSLTGERALERAGERAMERAGERALERAGERALERAGERALERAGMYAAEKTPFVAFGSAGWYDSRIRVYHL